MDEAVRGPNRIDAQQKQCKRVAWHEWNGMCHIIMIGWILDILSICDDVNALCLSLYYRQMRNPAENSTWNVPTMYFRNIYQQSAFLPSELLVLLLLLSLCVVVGVRSVRVLSRNFHSFRVCVCVCLAFPLPCRIIMWSSWKARKQFWYSSYMLAHPHTHIYRHMSSATLTPLFLWFPLL